MTERILKEHLLCQQHDLSENCTKIQTIVGYSFCEEAEREKHGTKHIYMIDHFVESKLFICIVTFTF
jgi:hypothetical protein